MSLDIPNNMISETSFLNTSPTINVEAYGLCYNLLLNKLALKNQFSEVIYQLQ